MPAESTEQLAPAEQIAQHRGSIDALDARILELLNERAGHSLAIRALKPGAQMNLHDPAREDAIIERLQALNDGPMLGSQVREVYEVLLKVMKEIPA